MKQMLEDFMKRMTKGIATVPGVFERLDGASTILVVLEPATMGEES